MQFNVITLFPKMFASPFGESIIKRAIEKKLISVNLFDLRKWAVDVYGSVDDRPFGGGVGMLLRPEPIYKALKEIGGETILVRNPSLPLAEEQTKSKFKIPLGYAASPFEERETLKQKTKSRIILLTAGGKVFDQKKAEELSKLESVTLICGHYEGFDQRIHDYMVDEELSIGEFVLTGGELPAMVVIDAVARLLPGVLGKDDSNKSESFSESEVLGKKVRQKEYPQYTRPQEFMGMKVPEVLVSGDPKKIEAWKKSKSL